MTKETTEAKITGAAMEDSISSVAQQTAEATMSNDGESSAISLCLPTDDKYFEIDVDGLIALKPEYRGDTTTDSFALDYKAESDNGVGFEGSKISELPEQIVIPQNVNGELVTGFHKGMFYRNRRIKEVAIPSHIKVIPNGMFRNATYLEKVENIEQIESVGSGSFQQTRIKEVHLPNLTFSGGNSFKECVCLRVIDIGKLEDIPNKMFEYCENLVSVLGKVAIKTIGISSFMRTRRLRELPLLNEVTSIGQVAFYGSAYDFEEIYNTLVANNCTFGTYATYKQFNDTDYWSDATFSPKKNTLNSVFNQRNPLWANKAIANYIDDSGNPCTYASNGCAFVVLAEIYSALEGVHFDSPEELVPILEEKGLIPQNPSPQNSYRYREGWINLARGLGYTVTPIEEPLTSAYLQQIYDALSRGALLYKTVGGTNNFTPDGGHAVLCYGINSKGELLLSDSSSKCNLLDIYENLKYTLNIFKCGSKNCDTLIVEKPVASE